MDFANVEQLFIGGKEVTELYINGGKAWEIPSSEVKALAFTAEEANSNVAIVKNGSPTDVSLEYSTNGRSWSDYTKGTYVTLAEIGDKVYFRNKVDGTTWSSTNGSCYKVQSTAGKIACDGKIQYLPSKSGYYGSTSDGNKWRNLFNGNTHLTRVTGPIEISATGQDGMHSMFENCTNLEEVGELCVYNVSYAPFPNMFMGCSKLTKAPSKILPTSAPNWGYNDMFTGCSSLVVPPEVMAQGGNGNQGGNGGFARFCMGTAISSNPFVHMQSMAYFSEQTFMSCFNLPSCFVVSGIQNCGSYAMGYKNAPLKTFDYSSVHEGRFIFDAAQSVPSLPSATYFASMRTDGQPWDYTVFVPDSLYDSWIATTGWQDISSHVYHVSEMSSRVGYVSVSNKGSILVVK